jgi:hypothetical protein
MIRPTPIGRSRTTATPASRFARSQRRPLLEATANEKTARAAANIHKARMAGHRRRPKEKSLKVPQRVLVA